MYHFYGSNNLQYFVTDKKGIISFYNKNHFSWFTELPSGNYSIVGVGNNGCVATVIGDRIRLFHIDRKGESETIEQFSSEVMHKTSSHLEGVKIDQEGIRLCICKYSLKSSVSEKFLKALTSVQAKSLKEFEILLYDINSKKTKSIYKTVYPAGLENYFKWDISDDFSYLIVRNPRKTQSGTVSKFSILDTATQKPTSNFELQDFDIQKLLINMEQTVLIDASHKDVRFIIIITKEKTSYKITPPANSEILHLARSYVAFHTFDPPLFLAKSFENNELARVSLKSLRELEIPIGILFGNKDSIALLYFNKEELCSSLTELCTLVTEVKRCELVIMRTAANQKLEPQPIGVKDFPSVEVASQSGIMMEDIGHFISPAKDRTRHIEEEKVGITTERESDVPQKKEKSPAHHEKIKIPAKTVDYIRLSKSDHIKILESLRLQLAAGIIDEDEYAEKKATVERRIKQYEVIFEEPEKEEEELSKEKSEEYDDPEAQKIARLLDLLQDRFLHGEINEETYQEMKARYQRNLDTRKR